MTCPVSRRDFLASTAAAAAAVPFFRLGDLPLPPGSWPLPSAGHETGFVVPAAGDAIAIRAHPFDLHLVRLLPGMELDRLNVNRGFLTNIEPDRLLHMFYVTAGLPSSAKPYGGWEAPDNELRGHYTGHYLSACALISAQTGEDALKDRAAGMIAQLAKIQSAHGNGYLSAFPESFFVRLRRLQPVWAPFYTYHKIMAGMLDNYDLHGNRQALDVARRMADWAVDYAEPIPDERWQKMLMTEFGGMNEVLYNLYTLTNEQRYEWLAHRFDHKWLFDPLADAKDTLTGVHGNTNIPKVIGAARRYELMGEPRYRRISTYFWDEITKRRAYSTGGTTSNEDWMGEPGHLAHTLNGYTEETCPTYNMLKLTRHLFTWLADAHIADYYERAYFNGILPTQHPVHGDKLYYTPLASGYWKLFGQIGYDFWCCTGTGSENFSKLGDSVYFHDDDGIWVNLFVPSEVRWPEKGVRLVQNTTFPEEERTTFTVHADRPVKLALRVHVPWWLQRGGSARLNGKELDTFAGPSSWFVIERTWRDGDRLEVALPMTLHVDPMPDDDTSQTVMYGPLVLVGRMGTEGLTKSNLRAIRTPPFKVPEYVDADPPPTPVIHTDAPMDPTSWVERVPGKPLVFRTYGQGLGMELVPLYTLFDERYVTYWRVLKKT